MQIYLAPMEGLLDALLRDVLTRAGGVDYCVTEFVRVSGSVLPLRVFLETAPELHQESRTPAGVPVAVQLLGSDPHLLAENAARLATPKPVAIDLNFGCPAKTVNRHRGGAVLLKEPEALHEIVSAVRAAVPAAIPVTAKMRLGYEDTSLAIECAQAIEAGGASELVVHARTKADGYKPPAYWEWVALIRQAVALKVIANGEIWTVDDLRRCQQVSACEDVMLGRGIVAYPGLAREAKTGEALTWDELVPLIHLFWQKVLVQCQPKYQGGRLKQWLNYLRRHYPEAELLYQQLRTVNDSQDLGRMLLLVS